MTTMRGRLRALALAVLTGCCAAPVVPLAGETRAHFQSEDVFGLEWANDPQISPDGRLITYVRMSMDIRSDRRRGTIWLVHSDGSGAEPVTGIEASSSSPRWSPDGTRIAYVSEQTGSRQLYVYWLHRAVRAQITELTEAPSGIAWSTDSRRLAFTMPVPAYRKPFAVTLSAAPKGSQWAEPMKLIDRVVYRADGEGYLPDAYSQVFVVSADGGQPRQVTHGDYAHVGTPAFTPDGTHLLISGNRHPDAAYEPLESDIYSIDLGDDSIRPLTDRRGPDYAAVVSPDGKHVAYLGYNDKRLFYQVAQLYVMDIDGRHSHPVAASLDRDVQLPQWSADSRRIYFQYEDRATVRIASVDFAGKLHILANDQAGTDVSRPYAGGGSFSVARTGRFVYMRASPAAPPVLATGTGPSDVTTVSNLNAELLGRRQLGALEEIAYSSSSGGLPIQGWILKPPGFRPDHRYPLILAIHGGPTANYGARFSAEFQLTAAAGYIILYVNPRGSTSYGEAFTSLIYRAFPGEDYADLMSGVDLMLDRGYIDPGRLFVMGESAGGVLTAWTVGHTNRFRAAVVGKPAINWTSFVLTSDETNFYHQYWFEGFPWDHFADYWKRSPLAYAGHVRTPTLVITGESDFRTPSSEAEQFYQALRLQKVEAALLRVPGAPHDISARPSNLIGKVAYIDAWFGAHDVSAVSSGATAMTEAAPSSMRPQSLGADSTADSETEADTDTKR
jgi:acylaminoacyl-peptidase